MNAKKMIAAISANTGMTKLSARAMLRAFVYVAREELSKGETISLKGFGTFKVIQKKERRGVDPKRKQPMIIAAKRTVSFRPGKLMAAALKKNV